jgi:predicted transcriptional regulator YdeE
MLIAGHVRHYTASTLNTLSMQWFEMQSEFARMTGVVGGDAYGLWYGLTNGSGQFTYLAGVRLGEFAPVPPGLSRAELVPLRCAVFQYDGPRLEVRRGVEAALTQWLPSSGYELADIEGRPDAIERYSEQFNQTGQGPVEVWLPINKR